MKFVKVFLISAHADVVYGRPSARRSNYITMIIIGSSRTDADTLYDFVSLVRICRVSCTFMIRGCATIVTNKSRYTLAAVRLREIRPVGGRHQCRDVYCVHIH
jgi:hypothetical protein